jgi:quinol monooxygenase YgiN
MRAKEGQEEALRELLLSNMARIQRADEANLAFAVHRSTVDKREFWLYETWRDLDALEAHAEEPTFKDYKQALAPLIELESVDRGEAEPLAVLGYHLPEQGETLPQRFARALATNDSDLLDVVYDPDVVLYTPLAWPLRGRDAVKAFVAEFHAAYPGLGVTLHDEFVSSDATRACFRFVIHFHNTGHFYGKPPTGERGTMSETHAVRVRDGRIIEQFVGDNNFSMPYQELVTWKMEFPRETPDPSPVILEASPRPAKADAEGPRAES